MDLYCENSAGGRSVPGRRRYPRLSPIATTLTTASWEMENPRCRPSPPCGAALWGDGTQPVVALGGTEAHMRRRRGGERDEACASWLRGLALRCEPLGRRIQGVRAGASCAGSPRGREMAATRARNGGTKRRIGRECQKYSRIMPPPPPPQSLRTRQPLLTKLGSPSRQTPPRSPAPSPPSHPAASGLCS